MINQIIQSTINPVVPSNPSLNFIELNGSNSPLQLVYPTTFIQSPNYLAASMIFAQVDGFTGGVVQMPSALVVTQSVVCTITNLGNSTITIQNFDGGEITLIEAGISKLIFLLPSDTEAGNWSSITLGTGTSGAVAADLAGFGLTPILNTLNSSYLTIGNDTSITLSDISDAKLYSWQGGNYTLNLDLFTPLMPGFYFLIKNDSPSNGILTLSATSIDSVNLVTLTKNQSCFVIYSSVDNKWRTVGLGNFSYGNAIQFTQYGILLLDGTAANPSIGYINAPNTGIFSQGIGDVSFTSLGTKSAEISNQGLKLSLGNYYLYDNSIFEFFGIYP